MNPVSAYNAFEHFNILTVVDRQQPTILLSYTQRYIQIIVTFGSLKKRALMKQTIRRLIELTIDFRRFCSFCAGKIDVPPSITISQSSLF